MSDTPVRAALPRSAVVVLIAFALIGADRRWRRALAVTAGRRGRAWPCPVHGGFRRGVVRGLPAPADLSAAGSARRHPPGADPRAAALGDRRDRRMAIAGLGPTSTAPD